MKLKPGMKSLCIALPEEVFRGLKAKAAKDGVYLKDLVIAALVPTLSEDAEKPKRKQPKP